MSLCSAYCSLRCLLVLVLQHVILIRTKTRSKGEALANDSSPSWSVFLFTIAQLKIHVISIFHFPAESLSKLASRQQLRGAAQHASRTSHAVGVGPSSRLDRAPTNLASIHTLPVAHAAIEGPPPAAAVPSEIQRVRDMRTRQVRTGS